MNLLKEAFFLLAAKPPLPLDRAAILMYHSVSAEADYFFNVESDDFERQMSYLAQAQQSVIALSELVRRLQTGESLGGSIVLTFDDGYRDNYDIAFPLLKKYEFPATIFVTTDMVGECDKRGMQHLSAEEMSEMHASGLINIQPHTKTHPKLATLSEMAAREEILGSKRAIEELLGKSPRLFAYPYGSFSEATQRLVGACGFDAAVSVDEGTVGQESDLYRLPRNSIDRSTTFAQFRGKVSTTIDQYYQLKHTLHV
ncbi:MAG TPA: polysaccharide deacetylase family protein [Candidatus Paceibacterota bacterium]